VTDWSDVISRVSGLSGRLLGAARLAEVAQARELAVVGDALAAVGFDGTVPEEARVAPLALERYTRRVAARRLATIARWAGKRVERLASIYEDEDRRSLRAITRGVLAGVAIEQRLSGTIATPSLPNAALAELARQTTVGEIAALLIAWENPYGAAIFLEATRQHPDPLRLQSLIDREYAKRALKASRRAGRQLVRHVRFQIDLENAWTAMALAGRELEYAPEELFVPGGNILRKARFVELAKAPNVPVVRSALGELARGTLLARVLEGEDATRVEDRALAVALEVLHRETRLDPLTPGVVLEYALRLRAELRDLARIIWGISLGVPRSDLAGSLVSV
jgi:vacuolar-type H+-ATPase subunit C/Vma6